MKIKKKFRQQQGFTLIEVTAVIVILGVLASVSIRRFDHMSANAERIALQSAVRELNVRESLVWANLKLGSNVWNGDETTWSELDTDLGGDYLWSPGLTANGGTLHFRAESVALTRIKSTSSGSAKWH